MRAASLLWRLLAAVLEFPELGIFGKDVKSPNHSDHQATHAILPSPFEEKHATEAQCRTQHQRANSDMRCLTFMQTLCHDSGVGIELAEVMGNIFIAPVTDFYIEMSHMALYMDALVEGVATPLTTLTIKQPDFVF